MAPKTSLKYGTFKLKALFAGLIVACCCCVGLFANSNANAVYSVTANDVNSYSTTDFFFWSPSGLNKYDRSSGLSPHLTDEQAKNYGLSGGHTNNYGQVEASANGFDVYGFFSSGSTSTISISGMGGDSASGLFEPYSYYWTYQAGGCFSGTTELSGSSNEAFVPSDTTIMNPVRTMLTGVTFQIPVPLKFYIKLKSHFAFNTPSGGTVTLSSSDSLNSMVYADGTSSNANMSLTKDTSNSNTYTLTVNDPHHVETSSTTASKSNTYTITPASGYKFKDIKIYDACDATKTEALGTLDETTTTYNMSWPSNITVEFAEDLSENVTLDASGGSFPTTPATTTQTISATSGSAMPALTSEQKPTRLGYTFNGFWKDATAETAGTEYYGADYSSSQNWTSGAATTLYAHWTANKYFVSLDDGDGNINTVPAFFNEDMTTLESSELPTKDGYTFDGYFDSDGKQYYNADGSSANKWDKASDTTLYAHWTKNADPTPNPTPTPDNGSSATTGSSASTSTQTGDSLAIYSILAACMGLVALGVFARNGYSKSERIRNRKH